MPRMRAYEAADALRPVIEAETFTAASVQLEALIERRDMHGQSVGVVALICSLRLLREDHLREWIKQLLLGVKDPPDEQTVNSLLAPANRWQVLEAMAPCLLSRYGLVKAHGWWLAFKEAEDQQMLLMEYLATAPIKEVAQFLNVVPLRGRAGNFRAYPFITPAFMSDIVSQFLQRSPRPSHDADKSLYSRSVASLDYLVRATRDKRPWTLLPIVRQFADFLGVPNTLATLWPVAASLGPRSAFGKNLLHWATKYAADQGFVIRERSFTCVGPFVLYEAREGKEIVTRATYVTDVAAWVKKTPGWFYSVQRPMDEVDVLQVWEVRRA